MNQFFFGNRFFGNHGSQFPNLGNRTSPNPERARGVSTPEAPSRAESIGLQNNRNFNYLAILGTFDGIGIRNGPTGIKKVSKINPINNSSFHVQAKGIPINGYWFWGIDPALAPSQRLYKRNLKRQIDNRLATHFHPAALPAQIAEVGQTEGRSQAKLLLKWVAFVGAALLYLLFIHSLFKGCGNSACYHERFVVTNVFSVLHAPS